MQHLKLTLYNVSAEDAACDEVMLRISKFFYENSTFWTVNVILATWHLKIKLDGNVYY